MRKVETECATGHLKSHYQTAVFAGVLLTKNRLFKVRVYGMLKQAMSEFKFACPVCGQHIKCESSQGGTTMECPTCFQEIVAPRAPATNETKLVLTGTKLGERQAATAFGEASNGRSAKRRPSLSTTPRRFPTVAIVLLVALLGATAAVLIHFTGKTSHFPSTWTGEANAISGETEGDLSPNGYKANCPPANNMAWTLNLESLKIPDSAAAGYVHGKILIPQRVILDAGTLTLRTANPGLPDVGISIYFRATRGENLAGQSVDITSNSTGVPWIDLRWKDDQGRPMKQTIKGGYAMRVQFGLPIQDRLPGKIYLCTPDEKRSYLAGEFNATISKPKNSP